MVAFLNKLHWVLINFGPLKFGWIHSLEVSNSACPIWNLWRRSNLSISLVGHYLGQHSYHISKLGMGHPHLSWCSRNRRRTLGRSMALTILNRSLTRRSSTRHI